MKKKLNETNWVGDLYACVNGPAASRNAQIRFMQIFGFTCGISHFSVISMKRVSICGETLQTNSNGFWRNVNSLLMLLCSIWLEPKHKQIIKLHYSSKNYQSKNDSEWIQLICDVSVWRFACSTAKRYDFIALSVSVIIIIFSNIFNSTSFAPSSGVVRLYSFDTNANKLRLG